MLRLLGILALGNLIFGDNRHRRNGSFLGSLFILPALMFGGWIAIAVIGGVLGLIGWQWYRGRHRDRFCSVLLAEKEK